MPTLREWREQAQEGVLDPRYVEHLRLRHLGRARKRSLVRRLISARATRYNARARKCGAQGRVSATELIEILIRYGCRCAYCGITLDFANTRDLPSDVKPGTFDHVKPLSRGGRGDMSNLVPACSPCNQVRSAWPDSALGVPAPHSFLLDG